MSVILNVNLQRSKELDQILERLCDQFHPSSNNRIGVIYQLEWDSSENAQSVAQIFKGCLPNIERTGTLIRGLHGSKSAIYKSWKWTAALYRRVCQDFDQGKFDSDIRIRCEGISANITATVFEIHAKKLRENPSRFLADWANVDLPPLKGPFFQEEPSSPICPMTEEEELEKALQLSLSLDPASETRTLDEILDGLSDQLYRSDWKTSENGQRAAERLNACLPDIELAKRHIGQSKGPKSEMYQFWERMEALCRRVCQGLDQGKLDSDLRIQIEKIRANIVATLLEVHATKLREDSIYFLCRLSNVEMPRLGGRDFDDRPKPPVCPMSEDEQLQQALRLSLMDHGSGAAPSSSRPIRRERSFPSGKLDSIIEEISYGGGASAGADPGGPGSSSGRDGAASDGLQWRAWGPPISLAPRGEREEAELIDAMAQSILPEECSSEVEDPAVVADSQPRRHPKAPAEDYE